jgi:hypothetical protein
MLPAPRAQKLSPSMNVELMDGQEVFGRCADGVTSQPHAGYPRWVTENIGHLGKVRQPPILGLQALSPGRPNQWYEFLGLQWSYDSSTLGGRVTSFPVEEGSALQEMLATRCHPGAC